MRFRAFIVTFLAVCLGFVALSGPASAVVPRSTLTYNEIRNTGLANVCPTLGESARGAFAIDPDESYEMTALCLQPLNFFVKEEPKNPRQKAEFVEAKLVTRETTSLESIEGPIEIQADGSLKFIEKDGMDFQPVTVKLTDGELVPFLFTVKELTLQTQPNISSITTSTDFQGTYEVPSYRTSNFLDPKGRGLTSGYDNAVARPAAADADELSRANTKRFSVGEGALALQVAKVDGETGEIAGTFESIQPSDTDMGVKEPLEIKIQGLFYGHISPQA
ncbi:photosystem II manganese-stabilizing polypeptide [Lyngbya confervoides]|uniref:Photosystem II extrinsic protein O n=1 Tax=Lyngbya confervoides BDU141951 TaxID=1574623 RepID=A0ABD4SZ41_9CYAN|nr:photosystem II manganese-stabilizing polypeptide [Lyngbya confervoides]MCM1981327.1 photosystem II manganese-stabilizing polypeptide [Lyngbya confervoides BDU141951]